MEIKERIQKMIDVNIPIILIPDHDFWRIDNTIVDAAKGFVKEWNPADGWLGWKSKSIKEEIGLGNLLNGLQTIYKSNGAPGTEHRNQIIVLKNIHDYLRPEMLGENRTKLIATLQMMAQDRLYCEGIQTTVIIVDPWLTIPEELKKYISIVEIPPLGNTKEDEETIKGIIREHWDVNAFDSSKDEEEKTIQELLPNLKGMTRFEIDRILDIAMSSNGTLTAEDNRRIVEEKQAMVRKEGLLEIVNTPVLKNDDDLDKYIGGLENMKTYLKRKAKIIANFNDAQSQGVEAPKGLFLVGVAGCGKSLSAKLAASLFKVPLLKLDMGSMMGKYLGESEGNLRRAIRIAEAVAPCVLWIDEIEKAFAGVGNSGEGQNDSLMRMFGHFLSWMQEKKSMVYVIATANNVKTLPPEFKRKGRFDEIFFVGRPNTTEKAQIMSIHLEKGNRAKCPKSQEVRNALKNMEEMKKQVTALGLDGYSGADIEALIKEAIETVYIDTDKKELTWDILKQSKAKMKSITEIYNADQELRKTLEKPDYATAASQES